MVIPTISWSLVSQASYRVRQFFSSLLARVSQQDLCQAEARLGSGARQLFRQMPPAEQRHALAVLRALELAGQTHPALLTAALLHDVGKSATWLTPIHKAIIVLLGHFWPVALDWLARQPAPAWRRPFAIHRRHPELGAQWAERAGCDPVSIELIRRHQEPPAAQPQGEFEQLLAKLQAADKNH